MGMCAEIIAIGPFSGKIADRLEYPKDNYSNVREGAIITERLFGILEGTPQSTEFALLLGITDPWDFNQHKVINEKINFQGLKEFAKVYEYYESDVEKLQILKDNGFEFHFRPVG